MPLDVIHASVGMHHNGQKNCYNLSPDVETVVRLLNFIPTDEGGTQSSPLLSSAPPRELFRSIRRFQEIQNNLGRTPRLSVDGHVDPRGPTLARLNQAARRIGPIRPDEIMGPPVIEPIPGFDVVAPDGFIIPVPRKIRRPNGRFLSLDQAEVSVFKSGEVYFVGVNNLSLAPNPAARTAAQAAARAAAQRATDQALKKAVVDIDRSVISFGVGRIAGGLVSVIGSVIDPSPIAKDIVWNATIDGRPVRYSVLTH